MATDNSGPGFGGSQGQSEGESGEQESSVGFGGKPTGDASPGGAGYGGVEDTGGSGRRSFKSEVSVKGDYGTELVKRTDTPDIGYGRVHAVVTFDGVVDYDGDAYMSYISVDEDSMEDVVGDIKSRVEGYDVIAFVEDNES